MTDSRQQEQSSNAAVPDSCARCKRDLSGERPVALPDGCRYCAACCARMATDEFEMETGEPFVKWIDKHPQLVMQHQPMEMKVRKTYAIVPVVFAVIGLVLAAFGVWTFLQPKDALPKIAPETLALRPEERGPRPLPPPSGIGYIILGLGSAALFGLIGFRQARAYFRASGFILTLKDGTFDLVHRGREETFMIDDIKQACVVRPGTVGATEGALGLEDGRMLTLDTCLTDLHALRVVMDLRLREEFPPSVEEIEKVRRDKLRELRGLS